MRNICVPTDFSDMADQAVGSAISLAEKINAKITLFHIIAGEEFAIITKHDLAENLKVSPLSVLNEVIETQNKFKLYQNKFNNDDISWVVVVAVDNQSVAEVVEILKADLVISGTTVINGYWDDQLIGDNTRIMIKKCKIPVITIKEAQSKFNISKAVFATNFKETHFEMIKSIEYIFQGFGIQLNVLYVATPDSFATTRKLTKVFEAMKNKYDLKNVFLTIYNDTSKGEGILHFVEDYEIDFVVMPTQGRTGIDYFLNSSIAEQVLDEVNIPVMTILNKLQ